MKTSSPDCKSKSIGPILKDTFGKFVDVPELNLAHLDLVELLRYQNIARLGRGNGRPQGHFQLLNPIRCRICIQQDGIDWTRPKHAPTMNIRAVVVFVSAAPPSVVAELGSHKYDCAEQYVHRYLRRHDHLEGFGLAFYFDVGGGPRHVDSIVEQIGAACAVESHLLESVEKVDQPIEQLGAPILPTLCFSSDQTAILLMKYCCRNRNDNDGRDDCCKRQERDVDRPQNKIRTAPCTVKQSMLLACVSTAVSLLTAATILDRPIPSIASSSECLIWSIRRMRILWMIASISAVVVIVT